MKNRLLKLTLGASLLLGLTNLQAENIESKMLGHIVHGTPWVDVRLPYSMTAKELAQRYYGSMGEVSIILKANRRIRNANSLLGKNRIVHIPVIESFQDQPELLGWVE